MEASIYRAMTPLPRNICSATRFDCEQHNGYVVAEELGDTEYEDPETGLWWLDMDCSVLPSGAGPVGWSGVDHYRSW